jgi:hypothetical protein
VSGNSGDGEKNFSLDGLLQSGNRPEELQGTKNQPIVSIIILPDLSRTDYPETTGPRDRKRQRFNNYEKEEFINLNNEEWHDLLQRMN